MSGHGDLMHVTRLLRLNVRQPQSSGIAPNLLIDAGTCVIILPSLSLFFSFSDTLDPLGTPLEPIWTPSPPLFIPPIYVDETTPTIK